MNVMLASRLGSALGLPGFGGPDTGVDERRGVAVVSWPGGYGGGTRMARRRDHEPRRLRGPDLGLGPGPFVTLLMSASGADSNGDR